MKLAGTFILLVCSLLVKGQPASDWKTIDRSIYSIKYPAEWKSDTSKRMGADLFISTQKASENDKFIENVNVIIQNLKGQNVTLEQYIKVSEQQIKTFITDGVIIESRNIIRDNHEVHKTIFTGKQGIFNIKTEQYYLLINESALVITFTAEQDQFDNYKEIGEAILNSFRLKMPQ